MEKTLNDIAFEQGKSAFKSEHVYDANNTAEAHYDIVYKNRQHLMPQGHYKAFYDGFNKAKQAR